MKNKTVIVDIDGTIANIDHRLGYIKKENPDWITFKKLAKHDKPIPETINLVNLLSNSFNIVFITGREDDLRKITEKWINSNLNIDEYKLFMRNKGDYRPAKIVKEDILFNSKINPFKIELALDDDLDIITMWNNLGIRSVQVR